MKEFWNDRYSKPEYAYGTKPNAFFKQSLDTYKPKGSILLPAEGEGRNAIYAAKTGLNVFAFDISQEAKNKALQLAKNNQVDINYQVGNLDTLNFKPNSFDVIGLVFAHFPPDIRSQYHKTFVKLLKPSGLIIMESFAKSNLKYREANPKIGGPGSLDRLFSKDIVKEDFNALDPIVLKEDEVTLNEGQFHVGTGKTIRFVGRKP